MVFSDPRRLWHSSITGPMKSLGVSSVTLTIGSCTSAILPVGYSLGLVTSCSVPSSIVTR
jgi:hypothetical protein